MLRTLEALISAWLLNGEPGLSSKSMARALLGLPDARPEIPADCWDFRRCALLEISLGPFLDADGWRRIAAISPQWAALVAAWQTLRNLMEDEMPGWRAFHGGTWSPKLNDMLKSVTRS